jgi:hypothetical protein
VSQGCVSVAGSESIRNARGRAGSTPQSLVNGRPQAVADFDETHDARVYEGRTARAHRIS